MSTGSYDVKASRYLIYQQIQLDHAIIYFKTLIMVHFGTLIGTSINRINFQCAAGLVVMIGLD